MRPRKGSQLLLAVTRSKAKMFEYGVREEDHIRIRRDPARLLTLSIGLLGDLAARTNLEDVDDDYLSEQGKILQFSADFFDAYLQSRLEKKLNPYLLLLGAASYYLCGLPGSSLVLAKRLGNGCPGLDCMGLEALLLWLLQRDTSNYFNESEGLYGECIDGISRWLIHFFNSGNGQKNLFESSSRLKKTAYERGTPRQLLFADVICAVVRKRVNNSTWSCLPRYSGISTDQWASVLHKDTFIRELWPAQHLIGQKGVFRGKSAIVQMPTSAGKTKAAEIIIRSSFLASRTSLAVIVAPFRALCHEIKNSLVDAFHNEAVNIDEMSDVLQTDFDILELTGRKQVLVVTPEKLIYVLRHAPELAEHIGLLIYDEGHQFDSGTRGVTYELLLTSLKSMLPEGTQTVLISAVISNTAAIGKWLHGDDSEVADGADLTPTYRTVGFASWLDLRGYALSIGWLRFVNPSNADKDEFFVPYVIKQQPLKLRRREYKERLFPDKSDGQAIALFLGLKLTGNGSVAIFCGRRSTASNLCGKIVDACDRGIKLSVPAEHSDKAEVKRLRFLYECNLGTENMQTRSAALGIFSHHGSTPQGIRLAVEHAMKEGLAKFVICTSTLAQGVNMPIRYLIVTSVYQGAERIKVRDFHNLIGRAGRAGMYTEGSILFADSVVYDKRTGNRDKWRWEQVKELLEPNKSEPCVSTILSLFEPLRSDDRKYPIPIEPLDIVRAYIQNAEYVAALPGEIASAHADKGLTKVGVENQILWRMNIIASIESYLMSRWDESDSGLQEEDVTELTKGTLGFFLSEEEKQEQIVELFRLLAHNIEQRVPDISRRKIYAKTLYGVWTSIEIESWVTEHIDDLTSCREQDELLSALWPLLEKNIRNRTFRKCDPLGVLEAVAVEWIHGKAFHNLLEILTDANVRIIAGKQLRQFKLDHVVDICESAFAYDGTLVVGAVTELIELVHPEGTDSLISELQELQKRLKYGVPSSSATVLYELGFADRAVSMDLASIINVTQSNKNTVRKQIKEERHRVAQLLSKYPAYFTKRLKDVL